MKTRNIAVLSTLSLALALTAAPTSFANPVSPDVTVNNPLVSNSNSITTNAVEDPFNVNGGSVRVVLRGELAATVQPKRYGTFYFQLMDLNTGNIVSNQVYSGSSSYTFRVSNNSFVGNYAIILTSNPVGDTGTFTISYL